MLLASMAYLLGICAVVLVELAAILFAMSGFIHLINSLHSLPTTSLLFPPKTS